MESKICNLYVELNPVLEVVLEQVKDRVLKQRVYFLDWGFERYMVRIYWEHFAYLPLHYIYTGLSGAEAKSDLLLQVHTHCRASRK